MILITGDHVRSVGEHSQRHNWQWFDPSHAHRLLWPDCADQPDRDILIAGCGTNQAAVFAFTNPGARVVGIDVSETSLAHEALLKDRYLLGNLELHQMPIEDVGTLGWHFDLIVSTGVLHHMADPLVGMTALGECLRPDGVLAVMLYARYGRVGVEMLQATFREMGLVQDEQSLRVVSDVLGMLPDDHPVRGYLAMAPDLTFDAGLVDTFLHGRDRRFTVDDCIDLVEAAGLVFDDWFLKSAYAVPPNCGAAAFASLDALPDRRRWAAMERINSRNACHFFTACRPERDPVTYRIDLAGPGALEYVPSMRHRCVVTATGVARPDWSTDLDPIDRVILGYLDGQRSIDDILAAAGATPDLSDVAPGDLERRVRTLFQWLWNMDFVAMGIPPRA